MQIYKTRVPHLVINKQFSDNKAAIKSVGITRKWVQFICHVLLAHPNTRPLFCSSGKMIVILALMNCLIERRLRNAIPISIRNLFQVATFTIFYSAALTTLTALVVPGVQEKYSLFIINSIHIHTRLQNKSASG